MFLIILKIYSNITWTIGQIINEIELTFELEVFWMGNNLDAQSDEKKVGKKEL